MPCLSGQFTDGFSRTRAYDKTNHGKNTPKTSNAEGVPPKREYKELASWKYVESKDITNSHKDGNGYEWKFCTKCTCKATHKKGFYQLTHSDSEHKKFGNQQRQKEVLPRFRTIPVRQFLWDLLSS
jgi:hypothetical protein